MSLVYVFLADGFEEVESLTAVDLLRRAELDVKTVSIMGRKTVNGCHNVPVESDILFEDIKETADMLVLPGGVPGANNLHDHEGLAALLKEQYEAGRWVTAICAAPYVFAGLGFLKGRRATSYPGWVDAKDCGEYVEEPVVKDGNVITSRGIGTAIDFALTLIEVLKGKAEAENVSAAILH